MNKYPIVYIQFFEPSFSWATGLYAVIDKKHDGYKLCHIRQNGTPELYPDGRPMITGTSDYTPDESNQYKKITETKLFLELP